MYIYIYSYIYIYICDAASFFSLSLSLSVHYQIISIREIYEEREKMEKSQNHYPNFGHIPYIPTPWAKKGLHLNAFLSKNMPVPFF